MGRLGFVSTAGVVAALLLGAAGCGGEPEPKFAPEPTAWASGSVGGPASPSPSPSASATGSAAPEPLDREETVRAWVQARNEALQDGDTSGMTALYAPSCQGCALMNAAIEDVYDAGGYYKTSGWTVLKTVNTTQRTTDLRASAAAGTAKTAADVEEVQFARSTRDLRFTFRDVDGLKLISNIALLAS